MTIAWDVPVGEEIVSFLFAHTESDPRIAPCATYRIGRISHSGQLALYRGDVMIHMGHSRGHLAELLMGEVCRNLAAESHGGVLFHAAGLARDGVGMMLPGAISAGKSTLTAWLTVKGYDYLTDELVFVPKGKDRMQAFVRPLNLKHPSRQVLGEMDWDSLSAELWPSAESELLPPEALNRSGRWEAPRLRYIVLPRYAPDEQARIGRLSPARAALALLECLVNAANLPDRGMDQVIAICEHTSVLEARYSHLSQLSESLPVW